MRRAAALAALLGAGLLAGHALADGPPLPPLPSITSITSIVSVTSSLPSVPTPVTSAPSLPTPTIETATTALAPATTSAAPSSGPSSSAGATGSTTASPGGAASPSGVSTSSGGDPSGQDLTRGHTSRTWISATSTKRRRTAVLTFVLPHAARLVFVVQQLAPVCRIVSRFAIAGHAGVNRVRFPRPASRLKLGSGTYRISGRTGKGRLVERVIVVVFDHAQPTASELEAARTANVCSASANLAPLGGATYARVGPSSTAGSPSANGPALKSDSVPGGVLGSTAARAAREIRPVLVALLGLAILLFGIASLPKLAFVDRRANDLLARHRIEIAGLGAAAFIAVVIAFLVD